MAQQNTLSLVDKLLKDIADEDDGHLLHKDKFDKIAEILAANKDNISSSPSSDLPQDKKEELGKLLPELSHALDQCRELSGNQKQHDKKSSVSEHCNPFKSLSHQSMQKKLASSMESLLKRTEEILGPIHQNTSGDASHEEKEGIQELYPWTTSYVDENQIYGWDKDALKIAESLTTHNKKFKAVGIAGVHGSGKTALAQKVFVHDKIKDEFPLRLWVCVGPEDKKDELLYRMLDNLGLDTYEVKKIVRESNAVKTSSDPDKSEIGVLLFMLYMNLYKEGYLIVFDDIRASDDRWHDNLAREPPQDREWYDHLAYGLPKVKKSAVIVTCRKEEHARQMVRAGNVFRPPRLDTEEGWKVFERAYKEAKKSSGSKKEGAGEEDKLYKELEEMKEEIVNKCVGLPVAIIEAAKGFAELKYAPPPEADGGAKPADQTKSESEEEIKDEPEAPTDS